MDDPHEVLGVGPEASADEIKVAYHHLVRSHHPDLHHGDDEQARRLRHTRMAAINAAYRMLNDPDELERFRRLQRRRERGRASAEPGRDGVRFTAADPKAGGSVEPAPGDPDFDDRKRAWREFAVRDERTEPTIWTARPPRSKRRRGGR
ncbi:MAG: J domain-containing protein [Nitriliruptor sp.]|nr:MAG: J domain-containing protein [Nitriliruptor sp.]